MKTKWKLTKDQQLEIAFLYMHEGWNIYHLSKQYDIAHQSVSYYIEKYELVHKKPKLVKPPEEVAHHYKPKKKVKTYKDYLKGYKSGLSL